MLMNINSFESNILNNVTSNTDDYSWKYLTCTYRPWTLAFKAIGDIYDEAFLLLISFIEIYIDRTEDKTILDFIHYYNLYLKDFFKVSIEKVEFTERDSMIKAVKTAIDNEKTILMPCDLIELHYNPMYKIEHRYKCMVIKGYDLPRELFYIIDNIHIDYGSSTILTDFTCYIDEMHRMNKSFSKMMGINPCFYTINKFGEGNVTFYTSLKYLNILLKKVDNNEIPIIHWEKEIINIKKDSKYNDKMTEIVKAMDFKYVFYDILFKMLRRISDNQYNEYEDEIKEINKEWENIRRTVQYNAELGRNSLYLYDEITDIEKRENIFIKKVINVIENITEISEIKIDRCGEFRILNNSKAQITNSHNEVIIEHDKKRKYDTWLMQDNATQLLLDNVTKGFLEANVDFQTGIGEDIHVGIIIKLQSGKKYLFGNVRGEHVAIYCPEMGRDFELYSRLCYQKHYKSDCYFRVEIDESEMRFMCLDRSANEKECVFIEPLTEKVVSVGLFSKTWEYLDHRVKFYDISYLFN